MRPAVTPRAFVVSAEPGNGMQPPFYGPSTKPAILAVHRECGALYGLVSPQDISQQEMLRPGFGCATPDADSPTPIRPNGRAHDVLPQMDALTLWFVGHHGFKPSPISDFRENIHVQATAERLDGPRVCTGKRM